MATPPTLTLTRATDDEALASVESLLTANDLPTADLRDAPARFYVAAADGRRVGVGGLERYGSAGLLRSVVVESPLRGRGYGGALCGAIEERAADAGVETLYLLTTDATAFFADRGYATIDRADAPDRIRETAQFRELCPDSATCMSRSLDGGD